MNDPDLRKLDEELASFDDVAREVAQEKLARIFGTVPPDVEVTIVTEASMHQALDNLRRFGRPYMPKIDFICGTGEYQSCLDWMKAELFSKPEIDHTHFEFAQPLGGTMLGIPLVLNEKDYVRPGEVWCLINGMLRSKTRYR